MNEHWWTPDSLSSGEGWHWRIGPLELWTFHLDGEWQLAHLRHDDEPEESTWSRQAIREMSEDLEAVERFAAGAEADQIQLQPRVADRSVVAKPRVPFHILPGQTAKVYVSTPLWIEVKVGRALRILIDIP
ncbi:MAG: hypothetical protein R3244_08005, partial [Thermoanaerobaculia bacterium]|nr:hypothetical protein [Thermoanaerobaculia bacterium]